MSIAKLLEFRNSQKSKKPTFLRQDAHKLSGLGKNWRKPKGMHSKLRKRLKGYRKRPSAGYSSPKAVRGLDRKGNKIVIVQNISQLKNVSTPITLSSGIGLRNKLQILKKCMEKKISVLNVKDISSFISRAEDSMKKKRAAMKEKEARKQKSREESAKKAEEAKKEETPEEKEAREKEEKRKIMESGKA